MALSLYDISVPVFSRGLGQLTHVLEKSLAHAKANDIDPATLVDARLAPDMITLAGQIQRASDASKLGVARISGRLQVVEIQGCGHAPALNVPEQLDLVEGFIDAAGR